MKFKHTIAALYSEAQVEQSHAMFISQSYIVYLSHKSAKTNTGNVFVTRDLDIRTFQPKINKFSGLLAEHFHVKFGDPNCIGF